MLRSRYLPIFGLVVAFVVATAYAQDKKDAPADPAKKVEPAKDPKDASKDPKKDTSKDPKAEPAKDTVKDPKKEPPKTELKKVEPNGLVWKFEDKKSFYQKMETKTDQNIKVMGLDVNQKQEQTFYFKWTPVSHEGDKWKIEQTIEGIQMKIDIAGNPVSFNSTQENPPGGANTALAEFFKSLKQTALTLTLDTKTLKIESVTGKDEFLKKLATANPQLEPLLKKILSDDALKQMADPTFGFLPPTAKKVGESWETTSTLPLGPIGTYTRKYKFTLKGPDAMNKDLELIEVETTLSYAAPTETDNALPFKIKASTLATKDKQAPGKIYFNTKLGRLEKADLTLELGGTLTIEIGGNTTTVDLKQTQTTNVVTKDESLLPKPEPKKAGTP